MGHLLRRDARLSTTNLRLVLRHRHTVQTVSITSLLQHRVVFTNCDQTSATTIKSLLQPAGSESGFLSRCNCRTNNRRGIIYWIYWDNSYCWKTQSNHSTKSRYVRHTSKQYRRYLQHVIYRPSWWRILYHRHISELRTLPTSIRSTHRREVCSPHHTFGRRYKGISLQRCSAARWNQLKQQFYNSDQLGSYATRCWCYILILTAASRHIWQLLDWR
jgi:hypothetical protein